MKWKIGDVEIKNQVGLAPMAGISNPAYMKICEEMGVGWAVTELISAEAIVRNNQKTLEMLNNINKLNIPFGVQIFGSNPQTMAQAAKKIEEKIHPNIIDINMGCPVQKVAIKSQSGSALLKNPQKVYEIVSEVVKNISIPVTVKIRSGWDESNINAIEIAKTCEKAGASAITIHARTRLQGYSGKADWNVIKQVVAAVKIPVIGNGDITSVYLAEKMLKETNCKAIMIGRAALGNPWLIKDCVNYLENKTEPTKITNKEKIDMIKKHFKLLTETKNEKLATLEIRSHIIWYLKGMPEGKTIKQQICSCKTSKEIKNTINNYEQYLKENKLYME